MMGKLRIFAVLCALMVVLCACEGEGISSPKDSASQSLPVIVMDEPSPEVKTEPKEDTPEENVNTEQTETAADVEESKPEENDGAETVDTTDAAGTAEENDGIEAGDWVDNLKAAALESQILTVAASGSSAQVSLHDKGEDGHFRQVFQTDASIGKNGIGKSREGDGKTPAGKYRFTMAFGRKSDPGCSLGYTQVDGNCFWVDDPESKYYNSFADTRSVTPDWKSAENLYGAGASYNYALALDYNAARVPGKGSAIFVHCRPTGGAGCIAMEESMVKKLLVNVKPGCLVIIDSADGIAGY